MLLVTLKLLLWASVEVETSLLNGNPGQNHHHHHEHQGQEGQELRKGRQRFAGPRIGENVVRILLILTISIFTFFLKAFLKDKKMFSCH